MTNRILTVERRFWQPGQAPPAAMRGKVYQAGKDMLGYADPAAAILRDGIDQTEMSVPAIISTIDIDRVDDVMVPEGCKLDNYARNPVVFFNHQDVAIPVAYARSRQPERKLQVAIEPGRRVVSRAYFVQTGKWAEEAAAFFDLIVEGALNMTSIGFSPSEWVNIENSYGRRYIAWDLLEWSFCGVPCNPYCEVVRSYLSNHRNLKPAVRKALEPLAAPLKAWAPGHTPDAPSEAAVKNKPKRVPFGKVALAKMQAAALKAKQTAQQAAAKDPANATLAAAAAKVNAAADAVVKAFPPSDNEPPDPADEDASGAGGPGEGDPKPDLAGVVGQLTEAITALAEMVQPAAPTPAPPTPPGTDDPAIDDEGEDSDPNPIDPDGAAGDGNEQTTPAEDEENSEELLDEYRNPPKKPPKRAKPSGKVMSNDQRAICREATEFLGEHAGEANLSKGQKAACKHHAGCLGKMLKDLEAGGDDAPAPADDGKSMDAAADLDAAAILAALQPVVEGQKKLNEKFYGLTGKSL